jgi:pimeloyl-ACP methyl ester carboxylesterase
MVAHQYLKPEHKHLLFILPGQSLSPRAFWDFKLPEGFTHVDFFNAAGIDVVLLDPAGYGDSDEYFAYDRIAYAEQIQFALKDIDISKYESKTILGFSTSTAPALLVTNWGLFDKVIIHSPAIRTDKKYYKKHDFDFETSMEKLKKERIAKISDKLIPASNKLEGWEEAVLEVIGKKTWKVPAQVVNDINNYYVDHNDHGFNPEEITCPILAILGEYDYESTTGGYEEFRELFPHAREVRIPNSTHFSMWENCSSLTRLEIINFVVSAQLQENNALQ